MSDTHKGLDRQIAQIRRDMRCKVWGHDMRNTTLGEKRVRWCTVCGVTEEIKRRRYRRKDAR